MRSSTTTILKTLTTTTGYLKPLAPKQQGEGPLCWLHRPQEYRRSISTCSTEDSTSIRCRFPLNPSIPSYRSFGHNVLPIAVQKGMAVFSMKSMSGSGESIVNGALPLKLFLTR